MSFVVAMCVVLSFLVALSLVMFRFLYHIYLLKGQAYASDFAISVYVFTRKASDVKFNQILSRSIFFLFLLFSSSSVFISFDSTIRVWCERINFSQAFPMAKSKDWIKGCSMALYEQDFNTPIGCSNKSIFIASLAHNPSTTICNKRLAFSLSLSHMIWHSSKQKWLCERRVWTLHAYKTLDI